MAKTIRYVALAIAVLLGASLFLFALALALGMAVLGIVALFAAYALSPEDTKSLIGKIGEKIDGWVAAMIKMVNDAGSLVREVVLGRKQAAQEQPASEESPQGESKASEPSGRS